MSWGEHERVRHPVATTLCSFLGQIEKVPRRRRLTEALSCSLWVPPGPQLCADGGLSLGDGGLGGLSGLFGDGGFGGLGGLFSDGGFPRGGARDAGASATDGGVSDADVSEAGTSDATVDAN